MRPFFLLLLLGGCAGTAIAPALVRTYDPAASVIGRAEREDTLATLRKNGKCLLLETGGRMPGQRWMPLWPRGTRLEAGGLVMPDGQPLPFGKPLSISGRFATPQEGAGAPGCGGRPFLVERANRNFVWTSAEGLVEGADPILVLRLMTADTSTRGPDGFGTSLWGQVTEVLKGDSDHAGRMVRLRLPQTSDVPPAAHDETRLLRENPSGRQVILFGNQELYAAQARARGGVPISEALGGTIIYLLDGERIVNERDGPAPSTLAEVRRLARAR